jgi:hypothetical protein
VSSPATSATDALDLPEYVPVPAIAKGAALNEHGYHVWQVERNLYAVTYNVYMSAFLTTPGSVVIGLWATTLASCAREVTPSLGNTRYRCDSTVRRER